jgi:hypothetical protein
MHLKKLTLSLFFFSCFMTLNAQQKDYTPSGPFVSLYWGGAYHHLEGSGNLFGGGEGIMLGWSFPRGLSLFAAAEGAVLSRKKIGDSLPNVHPLWGVNAIGIRYNFVRWNDKNALYAQAGYQSAGIRSDADKEHVLKGNGFFISSGWNHALAKQWTLQSGVSYAYTRFHTLRTGNAGSDISKAASSVRLNMGISWYPFTKK